MSILSEIAKENKSKLRECILLNHEDGERHATVSVFDTGERANVIIHCSSKRDENKLINYLSDSQIDYGDRAGHRIEMTFNKRTYKNLDHSLREVVDFIVDELEYN